MATEPIDSVSEIAKRALRVGNDIYSSGNTQNGTTNALPYADSNGKLAASSITASKPVYIDSSSVPQAGNIPFAFPLSAGATDTSFAVASIVGSATGSADELMHLTLVGGANATATIAGFYRVTITDNGGVITSGNYYAPFYVLS